MSKPDPFTLKRLCKFTGDFRQREGQFPVAKDFEENGFPRELIDYAVKEKILEEVYATLTTGAVVKGYKSRSPQ